MQFSTLLLALAAVYGLSACAKKDDETSTESSTFTLKGGATLTLGANTSSAKLKAYEFWLSSNEDCSSPVQVFEDADGKEIDMLDGPTIGDGDIENGTYKCVVMVMSDTIKFTPATTTGVCTAGEESSLDVFQPQGESYKPTGVLPDGTEISGKAEEQKIAVYLSTISTSEGGDSDSNPFEAPTAAKKTNGIKLTAALTVSADTSGTMVMDTSGKVESNNGTCDMQPPAFGFK